MNAATANSTSAIVGGASLNAPPLSEKPKIEKPKNGLAGLKHWRHDLLAGFLVAMVSTPFSIGIAVASGAPPITGLTSAIIAGFVLPFLGGSFVTISGPAAGLAPVLYGGMLLLGQGSLEKGYPLLLPVIMLAGLVQIILSKLKAARFSAMFPVPVVEGMLASIGLMIIAKQLPTLLGHKFLAHEFWGILKEAPHELLLANTTVLALGVSTLALIFIIGALGKNLKIVKLLSPQLFAVAFSTLIAQLFLHLSPDFMIHIPENPLAHGIILPDFAGLFEAKHLWVTAITLIITLTLIDGIESLATINAIDKIDPFRRKSNPDRTLFAMGLSNMSSSLLGGLTIIPGGVKSTANILAGGRTQWANFYNACFLLMFLLFFHQQISALPLAVLSAVLVYTGYKLCKPQVWLAVCRTGWDQFLLFTVTVLLTLATDLMWGILGGVAFAFLMNAMILWQINQTSQGKRTRNRAWLMAMFKNPVSAREFDGATYQLTFEGPLVCFNYLHLIQEFKRIPTEATHVVLLITNKVLMVEHTILDNLAHWMQQYQEETATFVELVGLNQLQKTAVSLHSTHILGEDEQQMMMAG
ncbi:MAG: SulP family inorganic anion transporter [Vampirovibrionales bacterium]|nr:SulP family inorganic anion transporter [Vampirovibrionales bacterium]